MPRCLVAIAVIVAALALPAAAHAAAKHESDLITLVNRERAARGLAPLAVSTSLAAKAKGHAQTMASRGLLVHSDQLSAQAGVLAENVGMGATVDAVHDAFMSSLLHRSNILGAAYTEVGIGVALQGEFLYVTELFGVTPGSAKSSAGTPAFGRSRQKANGAPKPTGATAVAAAPVAPSPAPAGAPPTTAAPRPPAPVRNTIASAPAPHGAAPPAARPGGGREERLGAPAAAAEVRIPEPPESAPRPAPRAGAELIVLLLTLLLRLRAEPRAGAAPALPDHAVPGPRRRSSPDRRGSRRPRTRCLAVRRPTERVAPPSPRPIHGVAHRRSRRREPAPDGRFRVRPAARWCVGATQA